MFKSLEKSKINFESFIVFSICNKEILVDEADLKCTSTKPHERIATYSDMTL